MVDTEGTQRPVPADKALRAEGRHGPDLFERYAAPPFPGTRVFVKLCEGSILSCGLLECLRSYRQSVASRRISAASDGRADATTVPLTASFLATDRLTVQAVARDVRPRSLYPTIRRVVPVSATIPPSFDAAPATAIAVKLEHQHLQHHR